MSGRELSRARLALALGLAVHLLFLSSLLAGGFLDPLFNDTTHRGAPGSDFFVAWKAGRNLLQGDSPYRIDPDAPPRSWHDYRYLPLSALTFSAGIALMPAETARRVWLAVNEILLVLSAAACVRIARTRAAGLVAASLWLAFTPYYVELFIGQSDFLVGVGFFASAAAMLGWRPALGEGVWVAATAVKWSGLAIAPLMVLRGRRRAVVVWCAAALGTGAVYFMLRPEDFTLLRATFMRGGFATPHAGNHGFQALVSSTMTLFEPGLFQDLSRWFEHRVLVTAYALLERAILICVVLIAFWATARPRRRLTVGEGLALWSSALAVGYNEFWEHQYVLLLPGLVLLYLEGRRRLALGVWWPLAVPTLFALVDRPHAEIVAAMPPGYDNPDLFVLLPSQSNILLHACKGIPAFVLFAGVALGALRRERPRGGRRGVAPAPAEPLARTVEP